MVCTSSRNCIKSTDPYKIHIITPLYTTTPKCFIQETSIYRNVCVQFTLYPTWFKRIKPIVKAVIILITWLTNINFKITIERRIKPQIKGKNKSEFLVSILFCSTDSYYWLVLCLKFVLKATQMKFEWRIQ